MVRVVVITLAALAACGVVAVAVWYLLRSRKSSLHEQEGHFRAELLSRLRKRSISDLDFKSLMSEYGVSSEAAERVATTLYATFCEKCLSDGKINDGERFQLDSLREALCLSRGVTTDIELRLGDEHYRNAALGVLADGRITKEEAADLARLRNTLGLSEARASRIVGVPARDAYQVMFRRVISDGRITKDELDELKHFRESLGITRIEANDVVRDEVLGLYRQWFYNVLQDGEILPAEEEGLRWLRDEFGLDRGETERYESQLADLKRLSAYRKGNLPSVKTSKLLEGGEICHWQGAVIFNGRPRRLRKWQP